MGGLASKSGMLRKVLLVGGSDFSYDSDVAKLHKCLVVLGEVNCSLGSLSGLQRTETGFQLFGELIM